MAAAGWRGGGEWRIAAREKSETEGLAVRKRRVGVAYRTVHVAEKSK